MFDRIINKERYKSFDRQNNIILDGMGILKQNPRITGNDLRNALLLRSIDDINNRNGLIERMELEITTRMYNAEETSNYGNNLRRSSRISRKQPQRNNFHSLSDLRSRLSERNAVTVVNSDSETALETESEPIAAGCPKSVRDRIQRTLEPQLRVQIRHELEPQLREKIRHELEPQLRYRIWYELEPQLRVQIRREIEPQLRRQIHREMESQLRGQIRHELEPQIREQIQREITPQLRVQIRRELLPTRDNIENEIREGDENIAWIDFLLYILDDRDVDIRLDAAIAVCEVCITPCMNRRPIVLNCGHTFCGKCIYHWSNVNRVCPKCRAEIRFSRSVFKMYPTFDEV